MELSLNNSSGNELINLSVEEVFNKSIDILNKYWSLKQYAEFMFYWTINKLSEGLTQVQVHQFYDKLSCHFGISIKTFKNKLSLVREFIDFLEEKSIPEYLGIHSPHVGTPSPNSNDNQNSLKNDIIFSFELKDQILIFRLFDIFQYLSKKVEHYRDAFECFLSQIINDKTYVFIPDYPWKGQRGIIQMLKQYLSEYFEVDKARKFKMMWKCQFCTREFNREEASPVGLICPECWDFYTNEEKVNKGEIKPTELFKLRQMILKKIEEFYNSKALDKLEEYRKKYLDLLKMNSILRKRLMAIRKGEKVEIESEEAKKELTAEEEGIEKIKKWFGYD
jgi:hypothetical protein